MKIDGLPVVDSRKKITLKITDQDVTMGNTKDPGACAAAACLLRRPEVEKARVHLGRTYVLMDGKWHRFHTSRALRTEIVAFDRGGQFEPGTYDLLAIPKSEIKKRGKAHTLGAPKHGRPGFHRASPHVVAGVRSHGANR